MSQLQPSETALSLKGCKDVLLSNSKPLEAQSFILKMTPVNWISFPCWGLCFALTIALKNHLEPLLQSAFPSNYVPYFYLLASLNLSLALGSLCGAIQTSRITRRFSDLEAAYPELKELREDILKGTALLEEFTKNEDFFCFKYYAASEVEVKTYVNKFLLAHPSPRKEYFLAQSIKLESSEHKKIISLMANKTTKY